MDVARDPFALTLYTVWQLQQLASHDQFSETLGHHDLASLISFAFNDPKQLPDLRTHYLSRFTPRSNPVDRVARESRIQRMLRDHTRFVSLPSSDSGPAE